ncbi:hypothetical protein JYQ62_08300 [Nostoc sp. UHCC 0702]|nr:hypothetical protein JYQ62_08300 [Nostoc sp. UHCC 0702]
MTYCNEKNKAIVTYIKNNQSTRYETNFIPIDVEVVKNDSGTYRFYGVGDDGVSYEFTANGINPGYAANTGFNGRGVTPTMNGLFIQPQWYYYVSGYGIQILQSTAICQIKVTGSGNNFTDNIDCPGNYKVSCDDDCPDGYMRCECPGYPGYCCIPCHEIRNEIASITAAVRGINRG